MLATECCLLVIVRFLVVARHGIFGYHCADYHPSPSFGTLLVHLPVLFQTGQYDYYFVHLINDSKFNFPDAYEAFQRRAKVDCMQNDDKNSWFFNACNLDFIHDFPTALVEACDRTENKHFITRHELAPGDFWWVLPVGTCVRFH